MGRLAGEKDYRPELPVAVNTLRSFFTKTSKLSAEAQSFISTSDDSTFLTEFIDAIFWDTGQPPFTEIQEEIRQILASRERPIAEPLESEQTVNRLWRHVMDVLASDSERTLTKAELEKLLSRETTAMVDRTQFKQMAEDTSETRELVAKLVEQLAHKGLGASGLLEIAYEGSPIFTQLPPLPAICSGRIEVLKDLRTKCEKASLLWIYGSTGYGKTTVANLLVRNLATKFLWFRLRDIVNFELTSCLERSLNAISEFQSCERLVVAFDDLNLAGPNSTNIELLVRLLESVKKKARHPLILVTSQGFAPSRLTDLLADQLTTFDMPALTTDEIKNLIVDVGLADGEMLDFWTVFIESRTKGHPQLVGAYLTDATESKWKFDAKNFVTTPASAESIQRESRKLLVESIRSPEGRELAKRLSVVNIPFSREFALSVGRMNPPLQEPGHAVDSLLGPWIEVIDNNHYCLSPLLEGYAASEVGQTGLAVFYRMTAYAWLLQKTFNRAEFIQFVTAALLGKEEFVVAHIAYNILSMKAEKFEPMAKEISLICLFGINDNPVLSELKPLARCWFRMALLRIAARTGQAETYIKLDAAIVADLERNKNEPLHENLLFTRYVQTCIERTCPIPMKERIRRAIHAVKYFNGGLLEADFIASLKNPAANIGSLLMVATSELQNRDDLEYLFDALSHESADIVSLSFSGFEKFPDMLPLLLDRVWAAEAAKDKPDWGPYMALFSRIGSFASEHKLKWLFAGAARAKMVISDEYLNDSSTALEIALSTRQELKHTHPVIDLAEATVRYHRTEYPELIGLFNKADVVTPQGVLTLERIFSLRRVIIACSHAQSWDDILRYTARGIELARTLCDRSFAEIAEIAFTAEKAWAEHEKGNRVAASTHFETALKLAEAFSEEKRPLFHALRLRLGAALGWLSYSSRHKDISSSTQSEQNIHPVCGMFTNLEEPPINLSTQDAAPYPAFWAMLAVYSAWYAPYERVKSFAAWALKVTPQGQYYLAAWSAEQALFANELAAEHFDEALISGLEYLRIRAIGSILRKDKRESDLLGFVDLESVELTQALRDRWVESVPSLVLEPILMTLCSTDKPVEIELDNWRKVLYGTFGPNETVLKNLEWIDIGLRAMNGDDSAVSETRKASQSADPTAKRIAQVIFCFSKSFSPRDSVSAQVSFLIGIPAIMYQTVSTQAFTRMVARRWIYLAKHQKFMLSSPRIYAARILDAASQTVPTIAECSSLLLLVTEATGLTWPQSMRRQVEELSRQPEHARARS